MADRPTLGDYLGLPEVDVAPAIAATVLAIADTARELSELISLGGLAGDLAATRGEQNMGGDTQKQLDYVANDHVIRGLMRAPVAAVASEELPAAVILDPNAPVSVAIDPLDGSSNIDTNASIGTIFSIRPARGDAWQSLEATFLEPGAAQLAAGFVIYGPQTSLVLTVGHGVQIFILNRSVGEFSLAHSGVRVPTTSHEYAINASNYRHWSDPIRAFVDDCNLGIDGPCGRDFNMRWIASLVADAYRILVRGGLYLYPSDRRSGYRDGRLRLVYEANPIAFLIEQAGGAATDGVRRILDLPATALHQRTPLVFGSAERVAQVTRYHTELNQMAERSPLFARRGLLLA